MTLPRLDDVFDPRRNSLNAIRLALALAVIVWHSFPLTGRDIGLWPVRQALGELPVDGFFAISGFLIISSWLRDANARRFLLARALRILPGLWVCLAVTAFAIAPLVSLILTGTSGMSESNAGYVLANLGVWILQPGIAGSLADVPYPVVWNGSLWTLSWECLCYLGVLVLGVTGALRLRATCLVVFVISLFALVATAYGPVDNGMITTGARFAIMFTAGALVYSARLRVPVRPRLLALAAACVALSLLLPDYRVVGALPLAYLLIGLGALVKAPHLRTDISYGVYIYAFPLQQSLAALGAAGWPVLGFLLASTAVTLPLAFASWYAVERPCMRLRPRRRLRTAAPIGRPATGIAQAGPST